MKRREFLKRTARGAAVAGIAGPNIVINGCSTGAEYDLLIIGGMVYDGTGAPGARADVAVKGDKVLKIAPSINPKKASDVIDARGMAVSPGFIDPHTHTDIQLLVNPKAESKIRQGVTTEIGGNCGDSWYPVPESSVERASASLKDQYNLDLDWRDLDGFFKRLERTGSAVNFATLIGNGTIRSAALGPYDRPPDTAELETMKRTLETCMQSGAVGMSSGLEYAPSCFSCTEELIDLCRIVARYGGVYATHIRSEDSLLLEAVDEALRISRESGASLEIAHFKTCYKPNWDKLDRAFSALEQAQEGAGMVQCDRYPYHAYSTGLSMFFPLWAREGKTEDFINRLKDPANDARIRAHVAEREYQLGSWDNVLISSIHTEKNKALEGTTILAAANAAGKPCYDFARDLIIEEENRIGMIGFAMSEDNLRRILAHPLTVIGSDGNSLAPYGPLGEGVPHPRSYGTFPRVLGKFVREENIMPLETAIAKMSSRPADKFGLVGRGYLEVGGFADIVVFDPDTVIDKATWSKPHVYPDGIPHVIVNGQPAVRDGEHTGQLPGKVLRKTLS